MIQIRFKLLGSSSYYIVPIGTHYTPEGILLPESGGVCISPDMLENIQYMDLNIPTIIRDSMGEAAWGKITYPEVLFMLGGDEEDLVPG